jgi:hypothetical protein
MARPKILSCCDEIMLRDEITGFDGTILSTIDICFGSGLALNSVGSVNPFRGFS